MTPIADGATFGADEQRALELYQQMPAREAAAAMGWSPGTLYRRVIMPLNAYKTREQRARRATEEAEAQRTFLQDVLDRVVTADVLDYLHGLPDSSVELTVTSIPFNCGIEYGSGSARADRMALLAYRGWMMQVFSELGRVMKPERSIVVQMGTTIDDDGHPLPLDSIFLNDLIQAGFHFTSRIFWPTHAGLYPRRRLAPRAETALLMTKRASDRNGMRSTQPTLPAVWNANPARSPAKYPTKRAFRGARRGELSGCYFGATATDNWTTNDWSDIPHLTGNATEKVAGGHHPAMFSELFAARCILLLSNPGELVMDLFAGSGTTMVAARRLGRPSTGCDLYFADEREARLRDIAPNLVSLFPGVTSTSCAIWEAEVRRVDTTPETPLWDDATIATELGVPDVERVT